MNKNRSNFERASKPIVRGATSDDIERLVELELETFHDVYAVNPVAPEAIRSMIETRMDVARELMIVGEVGGIIEGVMMCQRTDKDSSEVRSWEETTNNGTLVGTHFPAGKNFYIVNLAVTERGSAHDLSDQLIAMMLGKFVEAQGEVAQLLSRIPQFSQWLNERHVDFSSLSDEAQDSLAEEYIHATKVVDGKERLYDGVLQRYVEAGVQPTTLLRNGYTDPSSHNYGVLCTFENPLPDMLKRSRIVSLLAGRAISCAANYPKILKKLS